MRAFQRISLLAGLALSNPALAAPLVFDNFSGPVAYASGQFPTIGSGPWYCSGVDFAKCLRGGGQLTSSSGGNSVYYIMQTSAKPLTYKFIDTIAPPDFVIAVPSDKNDVSNMWHVFGNNGSTGFGFNQSYWCKEVAGCPTQGFNLPTSVVTTRGACPATVVNHSYIGRLRLVGSLSLATLQDAATGDLLCLNLSTHPILPEVLGPNFYLETASAPGIAFTSVEANAAATGFILPFLSSSARSNTLAAAAGLDNSNALGSGQLNQILTRSSADIEAAVTLLGGEIGSLSAGAGFAASHSFLNLLSAPLNNARSRSADRNARDLRVSDKLNAWLSGYGAQSENKSDPTVGAHKEEQSQFGTAVGLDYRPVKGVVFGGAVGHGRVFWGLSDFASSARADATQAGLYFSARGAQRYLTLAGSYSNFSVRSHRDLSTIALGQYEGHFHADIFGGRLEAGERILGNPGESPVSLFGAVEGHHFTASAYTENAVSGSSSLSLNYLPQSKDQVSTDLGLRIDTWSGYLTRLDLHGSLAWRHLLINPLQSAAASFAGGSQFSVLGAPVGRDSASLMLGAESALGSGLVLGLNFTGEASKARVPTTAHSAFGMVGSCQIQAIQNSGTLYLIDSRRTGVRKKVREYGDRSNIPPPRAGSVLKVIISSLQKVRCFRPTVRPSVRTPSLRTVRRRAMNGRRTSGSKGAGHFV
jgi:uncharacterized protein with beta-barrel porin domain